jgi:amino acid permease
MRGVSCPSASLDIHSAYLDMHVFPKGLIAFASARMRQAFKKQQVPLTSMPFKAPGSPWVQFTSALLCAIIIVCSGFPVFIKGNWNTADFFASYISEYLNRCCHSL